MSISYKGKLALKDIIESEEKYRGGQEHIVMVLGMRVAQRKCKLKFTVINKSTLETDDMSVEQMETIASELLDNIKYSKYKQKAYTYIYNGDKKKAIKYSAKMDNVFYEREEEISENPQSVRIVIDNTLEGKELEVHTGTENVI